MGWIPGPAPGHEGGGPGGQEIRTDMMIRRHLVFVRSLSMTEYVHQQSCVLSDRLFFIE